MSKSFHWTWYQETKTDKDGHVFLKIRKFYIFNFCIFSWTTSDIRKSVEISHE